jgi:hypothetical protein
MTHRADEESAVPRPHALRDEVLHDRSRVVREAVRLDDRQRPQAQPAAQNDCV